MRGTQCSGGEAEPGRGDPSLFVVTVEAAGLRSRGWWLSPVHCLPSLFLWGSARMLQGGGCS